MNEFEKLGSFYLGRQIDPASMKASEDLFLYPSQDLVTHAVCIGMTGSGKTGLCLTLVEEALIDNVPVLIIDPKGDIANLLLTFPNLSKEEFEPWANEDEARKKQLSLEQYAQHEADRWRKGLADWSQDKERIRRLKESADFSLYTPGANFGRPLSILNSFNAPSASELEDSDLLKEKINTTVTSLLSLLDIDSDPLKSREHILLSTLFQTAWKKNQNLDLVKLIQQIQKPPFTQIGAIDLELFFPVKERLQLALALNNFLASPGFEIWMQGDALDVQSLLYTEEGKPRATILSIAHLSDRERMFFVTLLLSQTVSWMRKQSGTTSLRAILYMDEIFGYFPPVQNPPSKAPLLTLLKQGRAFGLGVVLATQNPVDLDYKGLSNAGTWFIGRLQTERDKMRVLDGLTSSDLNTGGNFTRTKLEQLLSQLSSRVFLVNNVHQQEPQLFQTRWTMSYLRGPLSRPELSKLASSQGQQATNETGTEPNPSQSAAEGSESRLRPP